MNTDNFEAIKAEILKRAKEHHACTEQYGRAYKSENLAELMQVIKDNFNWARHNDVVTPDIIEQYREDFAVNDIYLNVDVNRGFLICDNATVEAYGNATVEAHGSATVTAYGNATVTAYGSATVTACDNATVKAYGSATVTACDNAYCTSLYTIECKLHGNAIYRLRSENTIFYANDAIKFVKQ